MKAKDWFKKQLDSLKDNFEFRLESLILDITENISKGMIDKNINRSELAELLKISPAAVTKILNGNANFTLKSLLALSDALDLDLKVEFKEKGAVATEIDTAEAGYQTVVDTIITTKPESYFTGVSSDWHHQKQERHWEEAA